MALPEEALAKAEEIAADLLRCHNNMRRMIDEPSPWDRENWPDADFNAGCLLNMQQNLRWTIKDIRKIYKIENERCSGIFASRSGQPVAVTGERIEE